MPVHGPSDCLCRRHGKVSRVGVSRRREHLEWYVNMVPLTELDAESPLGEHVHQQPVLTTPYDEPTRHWKTIDDRAIDTIVQGRRDPAQPLPDRRSIRSTSEGPQHNVKLLRTEVKEWRDGGWNGTSAATLQLLEYWSREPGQGPEKSLFFAQREAIESIIYLTEVGGESHWMVKHLKEMGEQWSNGLTRIALRMATGTGKTAVMACLIAWYAVNRKAPQVDVSSGLAKHVHRVVVICPGLTVLRRLEGLNPQIWDNIYDEWRLLPSNLRRRLHGFPVDIINWEKLQPKKGIAFDALKDGSGKSGLSFSKAADLAGANEARKRSQSPDQLWHSLLKRPSGLGRERVAVFNDEAHHCWESKSGNKPGVWMEALHALRLHKDFELASTIDFSATPIFINPNQTHKPRNSQKISDGTLVPWIVSEFALMESMEAGLVKIPQPPRTDSTGKDSVFRNLFDSNNKRDLDFPQGLHLVRKSAQILYDDYSKIWNLWKDNGRDDHPVFIVVANTKKNAHAIYSMLAGRKSADGTWQPSGFDLFSNVNLRSSADIDYCMNSILVLSRTNSPDTEEGEEFAGGMLGIREVGVDASEEELREVLQTVAQTGAKGQPVRCVVSVGMLTEGWDCQNVTHILGYRKFGSQLLCEQTLGRALRRRNYESRVPVKRRDDGTVELRYPSEYATVFGVPFERFDAKSDPVPPKSPPKTTVIQPVHERVEDLRIWIPQFEEYSVLSQGNVVRLNRDSELSFNADDVKSEELQLHDIEYVDAQGVVGDNTRLESRLDENLHGGLWELASRITLQLVGRAREDEDEWLARQGRGTVFAGCLSAIREWIELYCVNVCEADLLDESVLDAAESKLIDAVTVDRLPAQKIGKFRDGHREMQSAGDWKPFTTQLSVGIPLERSELNIPPCHSKLEQRIAKVLDTSPHVVSAMRNHGPERIEVPYKFQGGWARYVPDFFVRGYEVGEKVPHVVVEGKGVADDKSRQKAWWTKHWWIPCANRAGSRLGQVWAYCEIGPNDDIEAAVETSIREVIEK